MSAESRALDQDTIAAIATPSGRGGVSVIRVSGPDAKAIADRLTKTTLPIRRPSLSKFIGNDGHVIDEGLPAANGPGLELKLRSGEWISVPHSPGQLIVNIGDMLQEVTGGYLPSTSHRVATPDAVQPAVSRMSLPLFLHPRPDVVLSPRYTAKQYLNQRLDELGVA